MANREKFAIGEYYHIYNRGVDKRTIIEDVIDAKRFMQSVECLNTINPVGSLTQIDFQTPEFRGETAKLVEIVCYCLNANHYHLLLKEIVENGISEFMKRLGGGYTWYFNNRHKRSGSLFQGVFKSTRVETNEQLLHLSVYINLNDKVHQLRGETAKLVQSSWQEYTKEIKSKKLCNKEIILEQFKSITEYKNFSEASLKEIVKLKNDKKGDEMLVGKHFFD